MGMVRSQKRSLKGFAIRKAPSDKCRAPLQSTLMVWLGFSLGERARMYRLGKRRYGDEDQMHEFLKIHLKGTFVLAARWAPGQRSASCLGYRGRRLCVYRSSLLVHLAFRKLLVVPIRRHGCLGDRGRWRCLYSSFDLAELSVQSLLDLRWERAAGAAVQEPFNGIIRLLGP